MTIVEAFDEMSQRRLFYADSREAGARCSDWLPLGTHVTLRAARLGGSCSFSYWRSGFGASAGASCACEQSSDPECRFVVKRDSYCGAVFPAAQDNAAAPER